MNTYSVLFSTVETQGFEVTEADVDADFYVPDHGTTINFYKHNSTSKPELVATINNVSQVRKQIKPILKEGKTVEAGNAALSQLQAGFAQSQLDKQAGEFAGLSVPLKKVRINKK